MPESPAVIITIQDGSRRRKYVVSNADTQPLRDLLAAAGTEKLTGEALLACYPKAFDVEAQWYRRKGVVDEMNRVLTVAIPRPDGRPSWDALLGVEMKPADEVWASWRRPAR